MLLVMMPARAQARQRRAIALTRAAVAQYSARAARAARAVRHVDVAEAMKYAKIRHMPCRRHF